VARKMDVGGFWGHMIDALERADAASALAPVGGAASAERNVRQRR